MRKGLEAVVYLISYYPQTRIHWFPPLPFVSFLSHWLIPLAKIFPTLSSSSDIMSFTLFLWLPTEDLFDLLKFSFPVWFQFFFSIAIISLSSISIQWTDILSSFGWLYFIGICPGVYSYHLWLCPLWDLGRYLKLCLWILCLKFHLSQPHWW